MFSRIIIDYVLLLIVLVNALSVARKPEKMIKKQPIRNFGLLDKNLNTPEEYRAYRNQQKMEQARREQVEELIEGKRNEIFRKYLLPRVSSNGAVLKDFFSRF